MLSEPKKVISFHLSATESFYGKPPHLVFDEIAGFETSPRPYLLKYGGAPCHPDVIVSIVLREQEICAKIYYS